MITKFPPYAAAAFNELQVEDGEATSIDVAEVGGLEREVTLHRVRQDGVARFDLKNFVSKLFFDKSLVIPTKYTGWAHVDKMLRADYRIVGVDKDYIALNAAQDKGKTLELTDSGDSAALTLRPVVNDKITIPKYAGFPGGVSLMYKSAYGLDYSDATHAELDITTPNTVVGLPWFYSGAGTGGWLLWGDGTVEEFTCKTLDLDTIMRHTYATPGRYTVYWIPSRTIRCYIQGASNLNGIPGFANTIYRYVKFSERTANISHYGNTAMVRMDAVMPNNITQTSINDHFRLCMSLTYVNPTYFHSRASAFTSAEYAFAGKESTPTAVTALKELSPLTFKGMTNLVTTSYMFRYSGIETFDPALFAPLANVRNVYFMFGNSMLTSIPAGALSTWKKVTSAGYLFYECTGLTSLPADLFRYNIALTEALATFSGCTGLTSLPADLFRYNTGIKDFYYAFSRCTGLTSIPVDLFRYNTAAEMFRDTFSSCTGLTSIPENLFRYNAAATTFTSTFLACSITSIPENLFRYNTKARTFYSTFTGCPITSIPENLFRYNTGAIQISSVFINCDALTVLPANLFQYNTALEDVSGCFSACDGIRIANVIIPKSVTNCDNMYSQSGITSIDEGIFSDFEGSGNAPVCNRMFYSCSGITSIPDALLHPLTAATDHLHHMFYDCKWLTAVRGTLFAANINLTDITGIFWGCVRLTTIPGTLFDNCPDLQIVESAFSGNYGSAESSWFPYVMPPNLFSKNKNIRNFRRCFYGGPNGGSITGSTPVSEDGYRLWERAGKPGYPDTIIGSQCFYNQNQLTDRDDIPVNWSAT